ncbi:MAG: response regulator transcription factor [Bacteroidota bacterium]
METATTPLKIMLVDDHALVRGGIKSLIEDEDHFEVVAEASSGAEAIPIIKNDPPDLLISDIKMPEMTGIELVQQLATLGLPTRFLMLSMHDSEEYVLQSLDAGAHGYLLKDASRDEFLKAIQTVCDNGLYFSGDISQYLVNRYRQKPAATPAEPKTENAATVSLTKREKQILQLAASGMTNQEIADDLGKSKRTVEAHRFNLMKKLEVKNLMELVNKGKALGLIS